MTVVIASLFPELTNSQGDAENARALAKILEFHGEDAHVVAVELGEAPTAVAEASVIVLGHVVSSQESLVIAALGELRGWLTERLAAGAVLLAVGAAQKLLCSLDLLTGSVERRSAHHVDDLVVERDGFTRVLWGFQNSEIVYRRAADEDVLGSVVSGSGNADGTEGVVRRIGAGLLVGTNLHGPVCVRNPEFAQWLLAQANVGLSLDGATEEWRRAVTLADALWEQRRLELEL
jgi:CobQ-like glutamine amidotransferase family enzyme